MKKIIYIAIAALTLGTQGCDTAGVRQKNNSTNVSDAVSDTTGKHQKPPHILAKEALKPVQIQSEKRWDNGLRINWFKRGNGPKIRPYDVVKINYEVRLTDGTVVDGNQLLNREWLPFITGFQLQTVGWDLAFEHLKVGDFVEIFIPSRLARGEKGIKGVIPPNADNIVRLQVLEKIKPTREIDGSKVYRLEENKTEKQFATTENTIDFHYMVSTPSNPKYDISYRRDQPFSLKFSDFGVVKGLKKSLINAKKADKLWVVIPAEEAYGSKGLVDLVKPNEPLFYDIFVLDVH